MATMAKPKALAIPSRLTAVAPVPIPPTTAAPQPKNTSAKVPINSATCLFIVRPLDAASDIGANPTRERHRTLADSTDSATNTLVTTRFPRLGPSRQAAIGRQPAKREEHRGRRSRGRHRAPVRIEGSVTGTPGNPVDACDDSSA